MGYDNSKMVNGVRTITYKGKTYVEVAERVKQVHEKNVTFEVVGSRYFEIQGRVVWQAEIKVDGKTYIGSAEVKLKNAAPKSADETNPFECGETSAVGRALAWAGFGTPDSIASWDEIARSMNPEDLRAVANDQERAPAAQDRRPAPARQPQQTGQQTRPAQSRPANTQPARPAQVQQAPAPVREQSPASGDLNAIPTVKTLREVCQQKQLDWKKVLEATFARQISDKKVSLAQLEKAGDELPPNYCARVAAYLQAYLQHVESEQAAHEAELQQAKAS